MTAEQISIEASMPGDAGDFAHMVMPSGDLLAAIYDTSTEGLLAHLHAKPNNLYSYENSCFLKFDGKKSGVLLSYSQSTEQMQQQNTSKLTVEYLGLGYLRRLSRIKKAYSAFGPLASGEYLISNIAIVPDLRNRGLAQVLLNEALRLARNEGCTKLVLDVRSLNTAAIKCYQKSGFAITRERPAVKIDREEFIYYRMERMAGV